MRTSYVTTFYSFKGGVGRSTLLANVAHVLAEQGRRVLIWDLDVEAPGIHQFPGLEPPEEIWQSGFLEWLGDASPSPSDDPPDEWPSREWIRKLGDRVYATRRDEGEILVLPALGTRANLGARYAGVDWHALFVEHPVQGLRVLERVRDALIELFEPAHILIDARTGVSDLGGFLTGRVPDCTVLVGNYSRQSTDGLRSVYLALDRFATARAEHESNRTSRLERLVVASPVPNAPDERVRGRERWASGFRGIAPARFEVPLVENLLYAEDILVRSSPSSDAAGAYRDVAEHLDRLRVRSLATDVTEHVRRTEGERNVLELLGLLGFATVTHGVDDSLRVQERALLGAPIYRVHYEPGRLRHRQLLDTLRPPDQELEHAAMLVTDKELPDDTRRALKARGIEAFAVSDLEDRLFDRRWYAAQLVSELETSADARKELRPRQRMALDRLVVWAPRDGRRLLVLSGEHGSDKTLLVRRFVHALASDSIRDRDIPTPLLLSLREGGPSISLASRILLALSAVRWYRDPGAILHLLRAGKVLLVLDGLDEIAPATELVTEILDLVGGPGASGPGNHVLLTTRSDRLIDGVPVVKM